MALIVRPLPGSDSTDPPSTEQCDRLIEHYLRQQDRGDQRFVLSLLVQLFPSTSWTRLTREQAQVLLEHLDAIERDRRET